MNSPVNRAPPKDRPRVITKERDKIVCLSPNCKAAIKAVRQGEEGTLPILLPCDFVVDVAEWARVFGGSQYGWEDDRQPLNYQEDLADHWPLPWIIWLFASVGYIPYDGGTP